MGRSRSSNLLWNTSSNSSNSSSSSKNDESFTGDAIKGRVSSNSIQLRRTKKERKLRKDRVFKGGRWTTEERLNFLRGLRKFGPGRWKDIQTILTTR